jgi:hypothetical protein
MGLPIGDRDSRDMELTFGSTSTALPISTTELADWNGLERAVGEWPEGNDDFATLRKIVDKRMDWNTNFPLIAVTEGDEEKAGIFTSQDEERAGNYHLSGENGGVLYELGPSNCSSGEFFKAFASVFPEPNDPFLKKYEQLQTSFYTDSRFNIFDEIYERPPIRHVILAYGTNIATEIGYTYTREANREPEDLPEVREILWEEDGGEVVVEEEGIER